MSVRKRTWVTGRGEERTRWIAVYADAKGVRRQKSFARKKDADRFAAKATVEVREGVHVADSDSATISQAGALWIASGEFRRA